MGSVHYRMTADERSAVEALNRILAKQGQVDNKFKQIGKSGRGISESLRGVAGQIAGMATLGGVSAALGTAMSRADENAKGAAERIRGMNAELKNLLNMTDELAKNESVVNRLRTTFGFAGVAAFEFHNAMTAAGYSDAQIMELGKLREIASDPLGLAKGVHKLRQKFGDEALGGSLMSQASALGTAGKLSETNAGMLARIALEPLALGKELGFRPSEVLGAMASASFGAEDPRRATTQVGALLSQLMRDKRQRFTGKGIEEVLGMLSSMTDRERRSIFGANKEAILGLDLLLSKREQVVQFGREIAEAARVGGTEQGFVASKIAFARQYPTLAATRLYESEKAKREVVEEKLYGSQENVQEAIYEHSMAYMARKQADSPTPLRLFEEFINWGVMNLVDKMNPRLETFLKIAGKLDAPRVRGEPSQLEMELRELFGPTIEGLNEATENFKNVSREFVTINPDIRSEGR